MNFSNTLLFFVYTSVIFSLIWARFTFFKITSSKARLSAFFYDPIAAIHIGTTYYNIVIIQESIPNSIAITACTVYISALLLFWWGINTAKSLNFAFGDFSGLIVTAGPFRFVRHPFYTSYMLIWFTSTLLFNSLFLWITLIYLVSFYINSAKTEETLILNSKSGDKYRSYSNETNMFIPRIKSWKN